MTHATPVIDHDDQHTHGHGRRQVIGALLGVIALAVAVVMAPPARRRRVGSPVSTGRVVQSIVT